VTIDDSTISGDDVTVLKKDNISGNDFVDSDSSGSG
jgi:hypothetical protein